MIYLIYDGHGSENSSCIHYKSEKLMKLMKIFEHVHRPKSQGVLSQTQEIGPILDKLTEVCYHTTSVTKKSQGRGMCHKFPLLVTWQSVTIYHALPGHEMWQAWCDVTQATILKMSPELRHVTHVTSRDLTSFLWCYVSLVTGMWNMEAWQMSHLWHNFTLAAIRCLFDKVWHYW